MKPSSLVCAACLCTLLTSCAPTPRQLKVPLPPMRFVQAGYSLLPLDEQGWFVLLRDPYQLVLRKSGDNPDESFAIESYPIKIDAFSTPGEFVTSVKDIQANGNDPSRFKVLQHDVTAHEGKATACAMSHLVIEDNGAVRQSRSKEMMILEILALDCAHPSNKGIDVHVGYSQRYYPGHRSEKFTESADAVLNSLQFRED